MKTKTYTKKQITEAIAYWKKVLAESFPKFDSADEAAYKSMMSKQLKSSVNKDNLKFKTLEEINIELKSKLEAVLARKVVLAFEVDPDQVDHTVACRISFKIDKSEDRQKARQVVANCFGSTIYKVSEVPTMYDHNTYDIIYDVMSDDYYYKAQLGRDY